MERAQVQRIVGERYRVGRKIGEGGLSTVVEAVDTRLERPVAIKILGAAIGQEVRARFVREARVMARVRGDHVLTIYDCIVGTGGVPYLVMDLVAGSLRRWLKSDVPLHPRVATEIVHQVADGLETLHGIGIVHRDIKPGNILVDTSRARILLGDFGAALIVARGFVDHTIGIGTPVYMSPEALLGQPTDARSDLYSLGVVFFELLTGTLPFAGTTSLEMSSRRLRDKPPSPRKVRPEIPPALDKLVAGLLAPKPDQRIQSAGELTAALSRVEHRRWRGQSKFRQWLRNHVPESKAVFRSDALEVTMEAPIAKGLRASMASKIAGRDQEAAAWLAITTRDGEERQHRLGEKTVLGRGSECDVVLDDVEVTRRHCEISARGGTYYLEDSGSRNGTYVNGELILGRTELADRDQILVGDTVMRFIHAAPTERETAAQRRLRLLDELWQDRLGPGAPGQGPDVTGFAERLTNGLLRDALGYRVEHEIAPYRGIVGYMVEAPMLWIRHTRFPILYLPPAESLTLDDITAQLQASRAADYLALLIVVPPEEATGGEAAEVRRLVSGSVYRYDLAVLDYADLRSIIGASDSRALVALFVAQGIELSRLSPYVIRGPVPENMFFGREAEIKELAQNLRNHAVVGGRRMGKSSMFLRLRRMLASDRRFCAFYVNCEACFDHDDFVAAFSAATALENPIAEIAGLRPALAAIGEKHPGKQAIFLLDEVDELVSLDAASQTPGRLFKTLRALSHEGAGHFVFSGGRTLYDALHDAHSPFFNFCDDLRLYPLSRRSVAEIVTKPMRQLGLALADSKAIIDRIFAITSGHPNLVQYLCHRLVTGGTERRITLAMVDEVADGDEFVQHFVETAWSQSTPLEKLITLLPAAVEFSRDWLLERLGDRGIDDRRAIDSALATLELYALVRGDGDRLRFVLEYFPRAVRRLDVATQIAAQLRNLEEAGCSSSTAR